MLSVIKSWQGFAILWFSSFFTQGVLCARVGGRPVLSDRLNVQVAAGASDPWEQNVALAQQVAANSSSCSCSWNGSERPDSPVVSRKHRQLGRIAFGP